LIATKNLITWHNPKKTDSLKSIRLEFDVDGIVKAITVIRRPYANNENWPEVESLLAWLEKQTGQDRMETLVMDRTGGLESFDYNYDGFAIYISNDPRSSSITLTRTAQ